MEIFVIGMIATAFGMLIGAYEGRKAQSKKTKAQVIKVVTSANAVVSKALTSVLEIDMELNKLQCSVRKYEESGDSGDKFNMCLLARKK